MGVYDMRTRIAAAAVGVGLLVVVALVVRNSLTKEPSIPPLTRGFPTQSAASSSAVLTAPVREGGWHDPNLIVYNDTQTKLYEREFGNRGHHYGPAQKCGMRTARGYVEFQASAYDTYLGLSYDADDLIRFLKARAVRPVTIEPVTEADAKSSKWIPRSRYERDLGVVMRLLAAAKAVEEVPAMARLAEDPSLNVRSRAIEALGSMGPEAKEAIPAIMKAMGAANQTDAFDIADALVSIGAPSIPALTEALTDSRPLVRWVSAHTLARMSSLAKEAIPALIRALEDTDDCARGSAARALGEIGPPAQEAIPALLRALQTTSASETYAGYIQQIDRSRIPALSIALRNPNPRVRAVATRYFSTHPDEDAAVLTLIEMLKDESAGVRTEAMWNLRRRGGRAGPAVPSIIQLLRDNDNEVRRYAACCLGDIGPASKSAVPALIQALENKRDYPLQCAAAEALGNIGCDAHAAVPFLLRAVEEGKGLRLPAIRALGQIGPPEAKAAIPALLAALRDEGDGYQIQAAAAKALGNFGQDGKEAVPALVALLADPNSRVRACAAQALGGLGPVAEDAVPALTRALNDQFGHVQNEAQKALKSIRGK